MHIHAQHENTEDINTAENISYSKATKNLPDTDNNSDLTDSLEVNCAYDDPSQIMAATYHPPTSHVNKQQEIELMSTYTSVPLPQWRENATSCTPSSSCQ